MWYCDAGLDREGVPSQAPPNPLPSTSLPVWHISLIAVISLHMGLHGGNTGCRDTIGPTGQGHLVVLADMVVQHLIVSGPEGTQRIEVSIHLADFQL